MAATAYAVTKNAGNTIILRWGPFSAGATFTPADVSEFSDITVYLLKGGAFGGNCGFQITPHVAAETEIWVVPTDSTGTAISGKAADGGWLITEAASQLQPTVAAGAADVYAFAICHKPG